MSTTNNSPSACKTRNAHASHCWWFFTVADLEIYVTTAANAMESSWGTYCPGMSPAPPIGFNTCLGDLYSISWMEYVDQHPSGSPTLETQYLSVSALVCDGMGLEGW